MSHPRSMGVAATTSRSSASSKSELGNFPSLSALTGASQRVGHHPATNRTQINEVAAPSENLHPRNALRRLGRHSEDAGAGGDRGDDPGGREVEGSPRQPDDEVHEDGGP